MYMVAGWVHSMGMYE